jgi:glycosyltransferase involved in cell wall biosynthesis
MSETGVAAPDRVTERLREPANPVDLSLVIPVYNEVDNVEALVAEIDAALSDRGPVYEILLVDDGSSDGSFEAAARLRQRYRQLGCIRFRRNFGQTAAFAAGFAHARGDVIVTMDADRQNDPADIPALVGKLDEGFDVVNGWRRERKDGLLFRRLPSAVANWLIGSASGVKLHDRGCSLRAFRSEVVRELNLYGEMHRFIPELASAAGFTMAEVPVRHRPRVAGRSKYGLSRTFRVLLDLMTIVFLRRYGARPMHLFGGLGFFSGSAGLLMALYLAWIKIWAGITGGAAGFRSVRIGDRPLLTLAILLITLGVQFLLMGLLAELVVRTYYESQGKPTYHVGQFLEPDRAGPYPQHGDT